MKIVYLHHAHRDRSGGTAQSNPLSKHGEREAKIVGDVVKNIPVKTIYMGEYLRYAQTAEHVNRHTDAPIKIDARLNEFDGDKDAFRARTHAFLRDIIDAHENDDVVFCITSGVNLNEFLTFFMNCKPKDGFQYVQAAGVCPIIFEYRK